MGQGKAGPNDRSIWKSAGQLAISVEDRFRFTLVVCFITLGFLGSGALFYLSDRRAHSFNLEAANVAVQRWHNRVPNLYEDIFGKASVSGDAAPVILDSNRIIPQDLLPQNLVESDLSIASQANGELFWLINKHPLIEEKYSLILSEADYPELKIARESLQFQRWLIGILLVALTGACGALFVFNKHYIFRPLRILREALLSRKLSDVAKFRQSMKSKVIIERLEEKSRFPLEQFDSDEFGQIASILSEQDKKQKNNRLNWTKSFNTVDEPIAIFSSDGQLRHCNLAMESFFDDLEISNELTSSMHAENFLSSILQITGERQEKILRVINQDYPKITSQTCTVEAPEGLRSYRYSIATLNSHGERFAILSLIREQSVGNLQSIEDIILEHSNTQMKLVQKMKDSIAKQYNYSSENLLTLCEALVDNMHGLLEESNNASLATHTNRIEFNLNQFFAELQVSVEGQIGINLNTEKSCPTFIFGYPTHLRQLIKGIIQAFKESNPGRSIQIDVSYDSPKKGLNISVSSPELGRVNRNPSLGLFLSHYNPILALHSFNENELNSYEFSRLFVAATASKNQIESVESKLSNRELPGCLIVIGNREEHQDLNELLSSNNLLTPQWLTAHEVLSMTSTIEKTCALIVTDNRSNLKSRQTQKAINYLRENKVPLVLVSEYPRRGETITALRLGFASYLTFPIDHNEFNKLLMLTMNKSLRERTHSIGLLTKHTVRDLIPSLGNVLLGVFSESEQNAGNTLTQSLQEMGYSVSVAHHVHSLFELIHKKNYEYIICSNEISSGLKRRIQVSTKGTPCLVFGTTERGEEAKLVESKVTPSAQSWTTINTPESHEAIKVAFSEAAAALAARCEGRNAVTEAEAGAETAIEDISEHSELDENDGNLILDHLNTAS